MKNSAGAWLGLGIGDVDPEVSRVKAFLKRKFSYAAALDDSDVYTLELAAVVSTMQKNYGITADGVWNYATKVRAGYLSKPVDTRPTLYTVAGTWSHWDWGFQADTARELLDVYNWQPVGYPASFGFINPPFPGAPSYRDSVEQGVDEAIRLISEKRGKFALSGYSQGGEVVGRICQELVDGRLAHRRADLLGVATFGDPARQASDRTVGDGKGTGISRLVIPEAETLNRVTCAAKGDMYCTIPANQAGDQMHAVYFGLTRLGTGKVDGHMPILMELAKIAADPLTGGMAVVDAVIRAAQVSAHGRYAPMVPAAVEHLRRAAA